MEISKLYESAAEKLSLAIEACKKSEITLSSITLINTEKDNVYSGINWKRLNDSFEEEKTCSEYEAICQMLLAGETAISSIVTLEPDSKIPNCPCSSCQELIIRLNPAYNKTTKILTGKNSQVILTSLNNEIAEYASQFQTEAPAAVSETDSNTSLESAAESTPENTAPADSAESTGEPEGSAAHTGIDASGLKMIFDDWESSSESAAEEESKPFTANSLSSSQQEVVNTVQNMSQNGNNYQQPMNGMYQQPMNGMYQQPMNGMYQQQPMNGMYQQPMNGMYQQQPMNGMYQQPMNGMYQQPMNGMYQQQPMNGMYQQQPMNGMYQQPMNGMYQQQSVNMYQQQPNNAGRATASLYLNQQPNAQQASVYANNLPPRSDGSTYMNKMQAPVNSSAANTQSVSVYGTNINDSDNNAIFKDRLNDILSSSNKGSTNVKQDEAAMEDLMQSAKDKKKAAKNDAKFLRKQKKNEFN